MSSDEQPNIIDVLLKTNNYIIVISGLEASPINQVTEELALVFQEYVVVLDYMHLPLNDTSNIISDRLKDLTKDKKRIIMIKCKTFRQQIKLPPRSLSVHINISINDKTINNPELSTEYKEALKTNRINKYFNYKQDTILDEYVTQLFYYIIDMAEKHVYGDKYDEYKSNLQN